MEPCAAMTKGRPIGLPFAFFGTESSLAITRTPASIRSTGIDE